VPPANPAAEAPAAEAPAADLTHPTDQDRDRAVAEPDEHKS